MRPFLISLFLAGFVSVTGAQVLSVSTLAGSTDGGGYVDARGTAARVSDPRGTVDSTVADRRDHVIHRVTPAGAVTRIGGISARPDNATGNGISARFASPIAIAIALDGRLSIADRANHAIRVATVIPTIRSRAVAH